MQRAERKTRRMGKTYTGVDIGDSSIKLAVSDGQSVSKVAIEMLPEGLVADGRIVSHDAMADFIKSVVRSIGGVSKDVAFVVPGSDSLFRRLSLPAMTEKELRLNLPYEFRDYISQGKDRYVYDYAMLGMRNDADGQKAWICWRLRRLSRPSPTIPRCSVAQA